MKKLYQFITGTPFMGLLIVIFATAMAAATFIENDYGTPTAKALIYNAKWFELIMGLLILNFIANMFRFRMTDKNKWPVLVFHLAFILILAGAFISRYFGYEGIMPIREGKASNTLFSEKTYIYIRVDNGKVMKEYDRQVLFGRLGKNKFYLEDNFGTSEPKIPFNVEMTTYIPNRQRIFEPVETGEIYLHLVESSTGGRNDIFLKTGDYELINGVPVSLNAPIQGGINLMYDNDSLRIQSFIKGRVMNMQSQEWFAVAADSLQEAYTGRLYDMSGLNFVIKGIERGHLRDVAASPNNRNAYPYDLIRLKVKSGSSEKTIELTGAAGTSPRPVNLSLNGLNFVMYYGSKEIKIPFTIKLNDFIMERYPGTNSPSSYMSKVTVMDVEKNKNFDYDIYMNHVLDYRGFRFFQSSFDPDEKGTILSVNHDFAGTLVTYAGYFFMGLGMLLALFFGKTRFKYLSRQLRKLSSKKLLLFIFITTSVYASAQQNNDLSAYTVSKAHADKFGELYIQDFGGRIKPVNTYALEVLRKVYKKDRYKGLTAEQVLLSAQLFPSVWSKEYLIKASPELLGSSVSKDLHIQKSHTSAANLFKSGKYYFQETVRELIRKKKAEQNATDKEIINLDDRLNVWLSAMRGSMMRIYPKTGDPNHTWYTGLDTRAFQGQDTMVIKLHELYMRALSHAVQSGDYSQADEFLGYINNYQQKTGAQILPSQFKKEVEITYNRLNIFKRLLFYYMILGFLFLALAFVNLFNPGKTIVKRLLKVFTFLTVIGLASHVAGLAMRWYISGHAPWSDGYESVVFIAFVTIIAGLVYSNRSSKFTLAVTVLFSSFLLGIAHGSSMNPEISNLVPVLKSYWLMIHVAVITASYGFLGMSSLLGLVAMFIYILKTKNKEKNFNHTLKEITYISESSMIIGLYALSLGTFLGGVWANESWGRYWSWDPKEVWSLISMMVYVFVLHMRLIPGMNNRFTYHVAALFSIGTLIMTYFGVNYYLSGMHSYATGDPVPIPIWVVPAIAVLFGIVVLAYIKDKRFNNSKTSEK